MQVSNSALQSKVQDLEDQRQDLMEQRLELSGRMALIEQERQAGTAALLRVQGRLMELEASRPGPVTSPWWQRQTTWGLAGFACLVLGGWGLQDSAVRAAQGESRRLSGLLEDELAAQGVERLAWEAASAELASEVQSERLLRDADRELMLASLDRRSLELQGERALAAEARQQFEERLNQLIQEGAANRDLAQKEHSAREASLAEDRDVALDLLSRERAAMELERETFQAALAEQASAALRTQQVLLAQVQDARLVSSGLEARLSRQESESEATSESLDMMLGRTQALEERVRLEEGLVLLSRTLGALWR